MSPLFSTVTLYVISEVVFGNFIPTVVVFFVYLLLYCSNALFFALSNSIFVILISAVGLNIASLVIARLVDNPEYATVVVNIHIISITNRCLFCIFFPPTSSMSIIHI